jgi:hypothetical protein
MTLSEFERRCRGYLRRTASRDKPLRLIATVLLNAHRGENDPAQTPEEVMWLYGDPLPSENGVAVMSEEEFNRIAGLA